MAVDDIMHESRVKRWKALETHLDGASEEAKLGARLELARYELALRDTQFYHLWSTTGSAASIPAGTPAPSTPALTPAPSCPRISAATPAPSCPSSSAAAEIEIDLMLRVPRPDTQDIREEYNAHFQAKSWDSLKDLE